MRALGVGVRRGETAGPVLARTPWNSAFFIVVRSVQDAGVGRGGSEKGNGGAGLAREVEELGLFYSCAKCAGCGHWTWVLWAGETVGYSIC